MLGIPCLKGVCLCFVILLGDQQADDWGRGRVRSFLRPPFMCAYGWVSSNAGPSITTGPLDDTGPECLSKPRVTAVAKVGAGEEEMEVGGEQEGTVPAAVEAVGEDGPRGEPVVTAPVLWAEVGGCGEELTGVPADTATGVGGCRLETGSRGTFSMFSTSKSSSSVSGGVFSSL